MVKLISKRSLILFFSNLLAILQTELAWIIQVYSYSRDSIFETFQKMPIILSFKCAFSEDIFVVVLNSEIVAENPLISLNDAVEARKSKPVPYEHVPPKQFILYGVFRFVKV